MAAVLLAALFAAARLDGAVTAGAQAGSNDAALSSGSAGSLLLEPSLAGFFEQPGFTAEAHYTPWLRLRDGGSTWSFDKRQTASLTAALQQTRTLQWLASQRFRYGQDALTWDPGSTRPFDFVDALPAAVPDDLFTDTELGFALQPARGWALNGSAGYAAYGGASAASQQLLPLQQGPQIYLGLDHELTRSDELGAEIYASHTTASNGRQSSLAKLSSSWRRQLDSNTRARVVAGASVYEQSASGKPSATAAHPVAAAEVRHTLPGRLPRIELNATAALGPHPNPLTAELVERAELAVSARWFLQDRLSLRARAASARELRSQPTQLLLGAFDASLDLGGQVALAAGTEMLWQHAQSSLPAVRWLAFTALSFGARNLLSDR